MKEEEAGNWMLDARCSILDTSMLDIDDWMLGWLLDTGRWL
jgi:hypothetical protein